MNKSSLLIKAAQQSLTNSTQFNNNNNKKTLQNISQSRYYQSQMSNNLIQQIGNQQQYEQIKNHQSKYVDQEGNQVQQQSIQVEVQNKIQTIVKKSGNKNKFMIEQKSQYHEEKQKQKQVSPIKQFHIDKNIPQINLSNSLMNTPINSARKPGTLLKDYKKNLSMNSSQIDPKKNNLKQYLTNAQGLKQDDFYKVDYMNTGKYKNTLTNSGFKFGLTSQNVGNANFFKQSDDLDQIQDILSDIKELNNKSTVEFQYNTMKNNKILPDSKVSFGASNSAKFKLQKYKGNKNFSNFQQQKVSSKLDDLLFNYQFSVKNQYEQKIVQSKKSDLKQSKYTQNDSRLVSEINNTARLKRLQREQRRRQNKYYQEVKKQIQLAPYQIKQTNDDDNQ